MKFTVELKPGATYAELARHLQRLAIAFALGDTKTKSTEGELRSECGHKVGEWRIER